MPDHILVSELFGPTIQGEGALAGQTSLFLRTAGCDFRCQWCDSMHAVDPERIKATARRMTSTQICDELLALPQARWVTLSGGDPVIWNLSEIVAEMGRGCRIAVESQGSIWRDWLEDCDLVTVSPKPPSSGMTDRLDGSVLQKYHVRLRHKLNFKIVVFNDEDLAFAIKIHRWLPNVPLYLTAGTERVNLPRPEDLDPEIGWPTKASLTVNILNRYRWLVETALAKPELKDVTILPQLHVLLWGDALGR